MIHAAHQAGIVLGHQVERAAAQPQPVRALPVGLEPVPIHDLGRAGQRALGAEPPAPDGTALRLAERPPALLRGPRRRVRAALPGDLPADRV
ncbi:hypothetical protein BKA00_002529 [Actinomadura coerulea]|uniref:Uncharacterized protein n=1 Tax=Actinomadura coerulea TaxID=46159 RepID=A0A7X0FXK8_9ACTN|nr:hypothetical protein [Actinomadura coerulea]MBB6395615.1 hypothetical protein [Actinomadura coerulea]GGQ25100.1 hypothetical protein GCM10010187_46890 [Actinomadura coerulea]